MGAAEIVVVVSGLLVAATALGGWAAWAGFRLGDRPDDARVDVAVATDRGPAVVCVTNLGLTPVVVGATLRWPRPLERIGGDPVLVRVPHRTPRAPLGPADHSLVGIVDAGQQGAWILPLPAGMARWPLVAVVTVGQRRDRSRIVVRRVSRVAAETAGACLARRP
ncbi:hypothetical protein GHK86_03280 [Acidimicrobiaceae bacterium USS-CC1]|uniref:DUF58 domain-containing protein n=1 Tax=Acidiferrimicrobium australe TaxID=2664430 RepID=A0ABW9QPL8_9ACTN|nr:hypothetical protein [Acidiferrimicrobium australe]